MGIFHKIGRSTIFTLAVIFAFLVALAISDVSFKVEPEHMALVLRFGKPIRVVGLGYHTKVPFFDKVYFCNVVRVQPLELTAVEAQMSDLTRIRIDATVFYRIDDCLHFYENTGWEANLKRGLGEVLHSSLRETLGRYSSRDLSAKRNEIMAEVEAKLKAAAQASGVRASRIKCQLRWL